MRRLLNLTSAAAFTLALVACGQSDTGISTNIKTKFAADDLVKAHEINVTTNERVVTLSGEVDTPAAKERALRLALDTDGVRDVQDELRVVGTTGSLGREIERGADNVGEAIREGAEDTGEAIRGAGEAARDAVTDRDRDSDNDGR